MSAEEAGKQADKQKQPQNGAWPAAQQQQLPTSPASDQGNTQGPAPCDTEERAQVRSLSSSSSFSSAPTPAAADSDASPSPELSSQPSPGDPHSHNSTYQHTYQHSELRDSRGFLIKHESTKRSPDVGLSPGVLELGWTPGHEPASEPSPSEPSVEVQLSPRAAKLSSRQDAEISMSDDEEDEERPSHSAGEG